MRNGKFVRVRTRKQRKVPLAFKPLFLSFFHCIHSDREERPSASELLRTDDFVKFLSDWQINPLPLNVITVTGVDLILFFALTLERLSHLSISGLLRSYLVEMMKKKFQLSNSDQWISLPSRIKHMENFTKRLAESRNLIEQDYMKRPYECARM